MMDLIYTIKTTHTNTNIIPQPSEVPISCCSTKKRVDDVRVVVHGDFEDISSCMQGDKDYYNQDVGDVVLGGVGIDGVVMGCSVVGVVN